MFFEGPSRNELYAPAQMETGVSTTSHTKNSVCSPLLNTFPHWHPLHPLQEEEGKEEAGYGEGEVEVEEEDGEKERRGGRGSK